MMRLETVRPGKGQTLPVMFFGTFEVAWLAQSAVESWKAGVSRGYLSRAKRDRRLPSSIEQVHQPKHCCACTRTPCRQPCFSRCCKRINILCCRLWTLSWETCTPCGGGSPHLPLLVPPLQDWSNKGLPSP